MKAELTGSGTASFDLAGRARQLGRNPFELGRQTVARGLLRQLRPPVRGLDLLGYG